MVTFKLIPTREKNLYIPREIYILCLFCAKVTENSMIDAAYTLLSTILERSIFLSNVITKYDTDDARCPNRKNSEPRHRCTPSLPHIQTTVNLSLSSVLLLLLPLAK